MRTLSRHLLASYLRLFITVLFASMIAVVIVELLLNFDEILADPDGFSAIANYLFLRLPSYYFRDLIPVASFAAAFLCIGLAARAREVTAAKAGGIPPQRMVVPILGAAMAISLASGLLHETVVLAATREWSRREHRGEHVEYRQGSFWYHRGDTIYSVREVDADSRTLHGVRVFRTDPRGRLRQSLYAESADVEADRLWRLRDATVRSFEPSLPAAPVRVERRDATVPAMAVERDLALLEASAQTLSLGQLREYIRVRTEAGRASGHYREMLHARLANPWSAVAFALVAIPLGLSVERRRGVAAAAVIGIAILGAFYTARAAAAIFAGSGFQAAAYGPWLVLAALVAFGAANFTRAPR